MASSSLRIIGKVYSLACRGQRPPQLPLPLICRFIILVGSSLTLSPCVCFLVPSLAPILRLAPAEGLPCRTNGEADIAVNFTDNMFKGIYNSRQCHAADIPAVLGRAWAAGVDRIIVTGGSLEESKSALEIAATDGRLFCTVGVHPTRCKEFDESGDPEWHFQALASLAKEGIEKGKVVAIGECGLDYDRLHFCPAEVQKKYFEKQFELAEALKLPMFLHMRAAAADFCDILTRNKKRFSTGVAHSFTGSAEDRDRLLSFDNLFIGINGCSLKTNENLAVLRGIPVGRMMIETDSPYCEIKNTHAGVHFIKSVWPSKKKEKYDHDSTVKGRNEPCFVRQVLEVVAGCKGIGDLEQLSKALYHNTCRVFFPYDLDSAADALLDQRVPAQ